MGGAGYHRIALLRMLTCSVATRSCQVVFIPFLVTSGIVDGTLMGTTWKWFQSSHSTICVASFWSSKHPITSHGELLRPFWCSVLRSFWCSVFSLLLSICQLLVLNYIWSFRCSAFYITFVNLLVPHYNWSWRLSRLLWWYGEMVWHLTHTSTKFPLLKYMC